MSIRIIAKAIVLKLSINVNMLDSNLTNIELTKIIRSLVNFIVIDTKNHLDDNLKEEYIKKYLYLLAKTTNGNFDLVDIQKIKQIINNDIKQISA